MSDYGSNAEVGGNLTVTGSSTFNQDSADVDFRVESDGNANMLVVDAGNNRVGVGTLVPDAFLHVEGAVGSSGGDILKVRTSAALGYGATYGQLVKHDLTVGAGTNPIDTTLDLPAGAILDTLVIKLTTVGAVSSGTDYHLINITLDNSSGGANTMFSASFTEFDLIGNGSTIASGTMYYFNNIQPNYPAGGVGYLLDGGTTDIKLDWSASNVSTNAIMDVAVYYRKFDTVR